MVVRVTDFLNLMLVNGKFYTIFSFLFGMGFALQLSRLERNRFNGIRIFRRRLLLLLAIGLVHMSTLYGGDILTLYAVLGLVLPLVYKWSDRKLILTSAVLILLPIVGYTVIAVMGVQPDFGLEDAGYRLGGHLFMSFNGYQYPSDLQWVRLEDWNGYWAFVLSNPPFRLGTYLENWRIPKVLGVMIIGLWAGEARRQLGSPVRESFVTSVILSACIHGVLVVCVLGSTWLWGGPVYRTASAYTVALVDDPLTVRQPPPVVDTRKPAAIQKRTKPQQPTKSQRAVAKSKRSSPAASKKSKAVKPATQTRQKAQSMTLPATKTKQAPAPVTRRTIARKDAAKSQTASSGEVRSAIAQLQRRQGDREPV